ncbi:protein sorting system archaetidylserine synthase [Natronomonas salina]|uniref:protein sorting system archaetidylserine synthase n=1 Tax=Natronomonas salina TaxID=1710540 RepID=UPI0015B558B0|nr:protein sorting system archaetidylserine synthase [Natronomonas salina]QLD88392.1 protein sorting system archaetidylserine synthase [Natronomonas salina]
MQPRFLGELGLADAVTVANAALGFVAAAVAPADPALGARLILLAAIADGLDGVVARARGGTPVGEHLDSLADVASFGVAPAVFVHAVATDGGAIPLDSSLGIAAAVIPAGFVAMAVVRLGFYMLYDREAPETDGVQTTLAGTILAVAYLAGVAEPTVLLAATALLTYLMVASITYPELYARDAIVLGGLQALAVALPAALRRVFPRALLLFAVAYLVLAPFIYWRDT